MNLLVASSKDARQLAVHHRKMFEEIWIAKGLTLERSKADKLEKAYQEKLEKQIPEGTCIAWKIEKKGEMIASGAVSIIPLVPVPFDLDLRVAYLHSIYTEKGHRRQHCARQIVDTAIQYCKANNIKRIRLNASDAGRSIYEKTGFATESDAMRLFVE